MRMLHRVGGMLALSCLLPCGCASTDTQSVTSGAGSESAQMKPKSFGKVDGREVMLYTLANRNGMQAEIINYGGIVVRLYVPDRDGKLDDVVLGFDQLDGYLKGHPYFGAIIGRYGNRIGGAKFTLEGKEYTLAANNNGNSLHGGKKGFDKVVWAVQSEGRDESGGYLTLAYSSKDGEEGYPGTLQCTVTYRLTEDNALGIEYRATTDKPTPVNLTNHSYFNLAGQGNGDILGHEMLIMADRFTPVDETLIPTGELKPVEGTPFDFRKSTAIGARIDADDGQIKFGGGYDHNYVLQRSGRGLIRVIQVEEPQTGRVMEVYTTEPGVQFYTGNFLDGSITGKEGRVYQKRAAFCLETQHFPDSPNKPKFPPTILRPGEEYRTTTVYKFSAK